MKYLAILLLAACGVEPAPQPAPSHPALLIRDVQTEETWQRVRKAKPINKKINELIAMRDRASNAGEWRRLNDSVLVYAKIGRELMGTGDSLKRFMIAWKGFKETPVQIKPDTAALTGSGTSSAPYKIR